MHCTQSNVRSNTSLTTSDDKRALPLLESLHKLHKFSQSPQQETLTSGKLGEALACLEKHYAELRTMPNGLSAISDRGRNARFASHARSATARHSLFGHSLFRNSSSRSVARKRPGFASRGLVFANAASFSAKWAYVDLGGFDRLMSQPQRDDGGIPPSRRAATPSPRRVESHAVRRACVSETDTSHESRGDIFARDVERQPRFSHAFMTAIVCLASGVHRSFRPLSKQQTWALTPRTSACRSKPVNSERRKPVCDARRSSA